MIKSKKNISSMVILKIICIITLLMFPMMSLWGNYMAKPLHYDEIMDIFEFNNIPAVEEGPSPYLYNSSAWEFSEKLYEVDKQV